MKKTENQQTGGEASDASTCSILKKVISTISGLLLILVSLIMMVIFLVSILGWAFLDIPILLFLSGYEMATGEI